MGSSTRAHRRRPECFDRIAGLRSKHWHTKVRERTGCVSVVSDVAHTQVLGAGVHTFWRGGPPFWRGAPAFWRGAPAFWRGGPAFWREAPASWRGTPAFWQGARAFWRGTPASWRGAPASWRGSPVFWRGAHAFWPGAHAWVRRLSRRRTAGQDQRKETQRRTASNSASTRGSSMARMILRVADHSSCWRATASSSASVADLRSAFLATRTAS